MKPQRHRVGRQILPAVLLFLCAAALCGPALAQGGSGGNLRDSDSVTSTNILSPGDTNDFTLDTHDDETIIVSVTSRVFDPVAQVATAAGKVIAENDDRRLGDQNPLLLVHFAKGGPYKILIKAAKPGAGGQFTMSLRRFVAKEAKIGGRTAGSLGRTHIQWDRFPATAGQTLVVTARAAGFQPVLEIYAPNGEKLEVRVGSSNRERTIRTVFRALSAGNYYARIAGAGGSSESFALTVALARAMKTAIGEKTAPQHLDTGGLDLWSFSGKAGDVVRVNASSVGSEVSASLAYLPEKVNPDDPSTQQDSEYVIALPGDPKSSGEAVALLRRTGTYQVSISQPLGLDTTYVLSTAIAAKPLPEPGGAKAALGIGGSDYWTIAATPGQIFRFEGLATAFDLDLDLFDPRGEQVAQNDDGGGGRNALVTTLIADPGTYLLRVHAYGDGGSGAYSVRRTPDPVKPTVIGASTAGNVGSGATDIWSFKGKAGQTVILSVRSSDFDTMISVHGPDALEVGRDDDGGEGTDSLLSIRLPLDGTYTVWVTAKSGASKYSLQIIEAK
jgi:hypothetical protein